MSGNVTESTQLPTVEVDAQARVVRVSDEQRELGIANIDDSDEPLELSIHMEAGHQAQLARRKLIETLFDLPSLQDARELRACVPLGDVELLRGLCAHCGRVTTRAAGSTCIVEGEIRH